MGEFLIMFGAAVVIMLFLVSWYTRAQGKAMDKKAKNAGAITAFSALHVEGIGLTKFASCDIFLFEDKILIDSYGRKFEIPLERVRAAEYKSEQELHEKGKSVVGRALVGTLLVPGLGTIVGGMSGIGNKQVRGKVNFYLILNYESSRGELEGVTFLNNLNTIRLNAFCNRINQALASAQPDVISL
ncbi:hypothetical protein [Paenibacillus thermotolerans]|uniref:hypothetical protein n=1 Tax=Paenibacillus thermotolerans TaxID=3027807 RepID=UPI00236743A2|nr:MULTISPECIES: hypothetical protein [unclassified Paenibacillus]